MKHLPFIFPFVFWLILLISVSIRIGLWVLYSPLTSIGKSVRVNDVVLSSDTQNGTNYYKLNSGLILESTADRHIDYETYTFQVPRSIIASGILQTRPLGKNLFEFAVVDAEIELSGRPVPKLIIGFKHLATYGLEFRKLFNKVLNQSFSPDHSFLVSGMILGNGSRLASPSGGMNRPSLDLLRDINASGLRHLIAASGYNITLVILFISSVLGLLLPGRLSIPLVLFGIIFYVFIAGGEASVVRAALMGAVAYLIRQISGGDRSIKRLFVMVLLVMLFAKPGWLWDVGFQLSATATAGLIWLAKPIGQIKLIRQIPALADSLAAGLATLPVIVYNFGWDQVRWAGVIANVPASLLVGPVMGYGALVVAVGAIWPWGGRIIGILGRPIVVALVAIINLAAAINN